MSERNDSNSGDEPTKPFLPIQAVARVQLENGRWVVYLNVQSWDPDDDEHPIANNWKRINDYSTEQDARVAASWYEKSANRAHRPPTGI